MDSHIFAYYAWLLGQRYEDWLVESPASDAVLAYRTLGKCNIHFAVEAFSDISARGDCVAVALDVEGFFDNLDHAKLKHEMCALLGVHRLPDDWYAVFRAITKWSFVERAQAYAALRLDERVSRSERLSLCSPAEFRSTIAPLIATNKAGKGVPQGSPISALLSNVYLAQFDLQMSQLASTVGGSYRRYSDDILWIVPGDYADVVETKTHDGLADLTLELNDVKTDRVEFSRDSRSAARLQYLGFEFDGCSISLRSSTLARYHQRMNRAVCAATAASRAHAAGDQRQIYKRRLYNTYSHLFRRKLSHNESATGNFVTYGLTAAHRTGSSVVRRQVARLWTHLQKALHKRSDDQDGDRTDPA